MIEVLVAMLVLAIGLVGTMLMDSYTVRKNHESYMRTQAILQTQELADRMHANRAAVDDGDYRGTIPTTAPTPNCLSADCTPSQLAAFDLYEWHTSTLTLMPEATAAITLTGDDEHAITLSWTEDSQYADDGEADTDQGDVTRSFTFLYKPLTLYQL